MKDLSEFDPYLLYQVSNLAKPAVIMIQLVMSAVISHIDFCKSVLVGLPASKISPLHRIQNTAARHVLGSST